MTLPLAGMMSSMPSFTGGSATATGGESGGGWLDVNAPFSVSGQGGEASATAYGGGDGVLSGILNGPYGPLLLGGAVLAAIVWSLRR